MKKSGYGSPLRLPHNVASTPPGTSLATSLRLSDAVLSPTLSTPSSAFRPTTRKRCRWLFFHYTNVSRRCVLALVCVTCAVVFVVVSLIQFRHRQGPLMALVSIPSVDTLAVSLSPPLEEVQLPFLDLCNAAEVMETHLRGSAAVRRRRRAQLEALMDRFNHVPADGGLSGQRWSNATGLPLPTGRSTQEVRVRFVTASNRINDYVHIATTAATMAGVRFEMLGHGWRHFSFNKRMGAMLSYVQRERLTEADVIVGMDSDALMAGEDAYGFLEAFVASTAASEEEHATYAVRDIRLGRRQPPVLFGGEGNCMRDQVTLSLSECQAPYREVERRAAQWAAQRNITLTSDFDAEANPIAHFNAGIFVARVWALRRWNAAFLNFIRSHKPVHGKTWWCDQSSMGTLYLELRRWELLSGAMDGPATRPLGRREVEAAFYPPLQLPVDGRGPNGVPAGLVGYDRSGRLVLAVQPEMSGLNLFQVDEYAVPGNDRVDVVLDSVLRSSGRHLQTSLTGILQSSHRIHVSPRENVDCHGVYNPGVECAYRDAVLGMPPNATRVTPLIWHFAGAGKRRVISHYRGLFPWYTPAMSDPDVRNMLVWTLVSAPPTRVFAVDTDSDRPSNTYPLRLQAHRERDDLTFFQMCTYRYYEGW